MAELDSELPMPQADLLTQVAEPRTPPHAGPAG